MEEEPVGKVGKMRQGSKLIWVEEYMINQADVENVVSRVDAEKLKNSTVLITGATGFIGRNLVKVLLEIMNRGNNGKIIAVCRSWDKAEQVFKCLGQSHFLEICQKDILSPVIIEGKIDYIIHAASIAASKYFKSVPVDVICPNVIGTYNLLKLAEEKKVQSFLFLSSGAVYGDDSDAEHDLMEQESFGIDALEPDNCYAISKKMGENLCVSFMRQYQVPVKIIRIAHTYGPGIDLQDGHVYSDFVQNVLLNHNIHIKGTGQNKRPFCYISDAIVAILLILLKGECGHAYNMANNSQFLSIRQLAEKISYEIYPEKELQVIIEDKRDECYEGEVKEVSIDTKKLEMLGWKPEINVLEGFRKTVESFRS